MYACGTCIDALAPTPIQFQAQKGAGCYLCVDLVAPWAYQQKTQRLPTVAELQTFVDTPPDATTSYMRAHETFQSLPACERADWLQAVCGRRADGVESYTIPLTGGKPVVASDESSGLSGGAIAGIILGCLVVLVLTGITVWLHHLKTEKQPNKTERHERESVSGLHNISGSAPENNKLPETLHDTPVATSSVTPMHAEVDQLPEPQNPISDGSSAITNSDTIQHAPPATAKFVPVEAEECKTAEPTTPVAALPTSVNPAHKKVTYRRIGDINHPRLQQPPPAPPQQWLHALKEFRKVGVEPSTWWVYNHANNSTGVPVEDLIDDLKRFAEAKGQHAATPDTV